ncbi:cytochrome c oxidase subunit II [Pseudalkalibacillus berkeleyi]|uniref:Cytochrome c oxidase subunit 2 n=1 Tax=Pseudalkalibacillus berkeleyi TaxID=1069813 RepID=A0ABS9GZD1_9BACL|nr:cytochrome c oxidase subunit II [Pseudalkalibacillus berkeleyi]MCF6136970.1 cytochrome c oxidase subunit II [Pseudalkalibacillus berkeleyi]
MKRWLRLGRIVPLLGIMMLGLMGCGNEQISALQPQGKGASAVFDLMILSLAIMVVVLVIVFILFGYVLVKFRERKGDDSIPEQVEGNHLLEVLWTAIPIVLLVVLAVPTVTATFDLSVSEKSAEQSADGAEEDKGPMTINVTAHQYWWEFEYPDQEIVTAQELYLPVDERVNVNLSSADVIHSFWIPTISGKMDTNPGDKLENKMWLHPEKVGTYQGACAELCGDSHALMYFKVKVLEKDDFNAWVKSMKETKYDDAPSQVAQGQKIFESNCLQCHAVGDKGGNVGPSLTGFSDNEKVAGILEHNKDNIKKWINDPQDVKPGNNMPDFDFNEKQLDALADYLLELKTAE